MCPATFRRTLFLALCILVPGPAAAQCILANPSFEILGSGGPVFGGWNQFGIVGSTSEAPHGQRAARVTGPDLGGYDVSGYWQELDSAPGDIWNAKVCVWHDGANPLVGEARAILNIEWRDAGDNLISYESFPVADPGTATDEVQFIDVTSGPAPANTVKARLLLGVLQGPSDPVPVVYYDQAQFHENGPPSIDAVQWNDFPGGTTLDFSGRTWRVKGPGYYGPGPNNFANGSNHVWVDGDDRLHMTVKQLGGQWYSTEIVLEDALGYGDYIFTTYGEVDAHHRNVVLGLFLWQYQQCYDYAFTWWNAYNEIDIEYSQWGNPGNDYGQFVVQPFDWPGNINRYEITTSPGEITSHAINWLPDRIEYRSWRGGPDDEATSTPIHSWNYAGFHIPRPEQPRVHINLWTIDPPDTNQEIVFDAFTFVAACSGPHCDDDVTGVPEGLVTPTFTRVAPNPFASRTAVTFTLEEAMPVTVAVYTVAGRHVRTLREGAATAGDHRVEWDGRDAQGRTVPAGVYLYRVVAGDRIESRRVVRLR